MANFRSEEFVQESPVSKRMCTDGLHRLADSVGSSPRIPRKTSLERNRTNILLAIVLKSTTREIQLFPRFFS